MKALSAIASALDFLPGWLWAIAWAFAIAGCLTAVGQLKTERTAHANTRAEQAAQIARMEADARQAEARHRRVEGELTARILEDNYEAQTRLDKAVDDLAAASAAGQLLRKQLAALTAASCAPAAATAAAGDGPAAQAARDLLANVQRRLDEATEGIAGFADAASTAGAVCERAYDRARGALKLEVPRAAAVL